jgi:hypothetical protein
MLLGAWGALIPFVGPYFNFSYTPDDPWHWNAARGWLEVAPGAATFVGGALLLLSASRAMTLLGAWLAIAGGAWFVIGPQLQDAWNIGSPGQPAGTGEGIQALEAIAMFYGLGALILFLSSAAFGRLSLVSPRDVRAAQRREEAAAAAAAEREAAERDAASRSITARDPAAREAAAREAAERDDTRAETRNADPQDTESRNADYTGEPATDAPVGPGQHARSEGGVPYAAGSGGRTAPGDGPAYDPNRR